MYELHLHADVFNEHFLIAIIRIQIEVCIDFNIVYFFSEHPLWRASIGFASNLLNFEYGPKWNAKKHVLLFHKPEEFKGKDCIRSTFWKCPNFFVCVRTNTHKRWFLDYVNVITHVSVVRCIPINSRLQPRIKIKSSEIVENHKTQDEFEDGQNRPRHSRDMAILVRQTSMIFLVFAL